VCCCVIASSRVEDRRRRSRQDRRPSSLSQRECSRRLYPGQGGRQADWLFCGRRRMHAAHHACVWAGPGRALDTRHFALGQDCSTCHQTWHCGIGGPVVHGHRLGSSASPSPSSTVTHPTGPHQLRLMASPSYHFTSRTCFPQRIVRVS
jgi:hypothetical protein